MFLLRTFLSILNALNQSRNGLQSGSLVYLTWVIQTGLRPLNWTPLNLDGSIMICYAHTECYGKLEMDHTDVFDQTTVGYQWPLMEIVTKALSYDT